MSAIFLFIKYKQKTTGSYDLNHDYDREEIEEIESKMQSDQDPENIYGHSRNMKEYDQLNGHRQVLQGVADLESTEVTIYNKERLTILQMQRILRNNKDRS